MCSINSDDDENDDEVDTMDDAEDQEEQISVEHKDVGERMDAAEEQMIADVVVIVGNGLEAVGIDLALDRNAGAAGGHGNTDRTDPAARASPFQLKTIRRKEKKKTIQKFQFSAMFVE